MNSKKIDIIRTKNIQKNNNKIISQDQKRNLRAKKRSAITKKIEVFAANAGKAREAKIKEKINNINLITDSKIRSLEKAITSVALVVDETAEKAKLENSLLMKYFKFRLKLIANSFEKKRQRAFLKEKIAKITPEECKSQIDKYNVDEGAASERWDKRIFALLDKTSVGQLQTKLRKTDILRKKKIAAFEKRALATPPFNAVKLARDKYEFFKSYYIFGMEIRDIFSSISAHFRKYSMYYILAFIILIFGLQTKSIIEPQNFSNILSNNAYILFMGIGMLLVIVCGCIDLSVGALMGFSTALSVYVYNQMGQDIGLTVIIMLLFGMGFGFFQGVLVGYFKMPSFIVTLGGMLLFQGLILVLTNSVTFIPIGGYKSTFVQFVLGNIYDPVNSNGLHVYSFLIIFLVGLLVAGLLMLGRFSKIKYGITTSNPLMFAVKIAFTIALFSVVAYLVGYSEFGLQYYMIYLVVLVALFIFVTQNTSFGRSVFAVGGNKKAASLSGINAPRTTTIVFIINGMICAFTGIIAAGIAISASPQNASQGYELDVISSVFIGGASMAGGIGSIPGTLIGGLILGFISSGMSLLNLERDKIMIIKAVILLAAVGYDVYTHRKVS